MSACLYVYMLQVFCSKCTEWRVAVPWEEGRKGRTCRSCHLLLTNRNSSHQPPTELPVRPKGLLEVRDCLV